MVKMGSSTGDEHLYSSGGTGGGAVQLRNGMRSGPRIGLGCMRARSRLRYLLRYVKYATGWMKEFDALEHFHFVYIYIDTPPPVPPTHART